MILDKDMAKRRQMQELKKLMYKLMAEEGDEEMNPGELDEMVAQSEEAVDDELHGEMMPPDDPGMAADDAMMEEEGDEYAEDFFKPKMEAKRRPGTAIMIAKAQREEAPLADLEKKIKKDIPSNFKKKKFKWA